MSEPLNDYIVRLEKRVEELEELTAPRVEGWQPRIIADMQRANEVVNKSEGAVDYQVAMIALALITRQFLRELPEPAPPRETGGR